MNRREGLTAYALIVCTLLLGLGLRAADSFDGSWTMQRSEEPGKVGFTLIHQRHGHSSNHESTWPASAFVGLDVSKPGKQ